MKRARQDQRIRESAMRDAESPLEAAPVPPTPWYIRGPRGGLYVATGAITRKVSNEAAEAWMRGEVIVADLSEGVRYLRPGTRAHLAAMEAIR